MQCEKRRLEGFLGLLTDMITRRTLLGAPKCAFRDLRRELETEFLILVIVVVVPTLMFCLDRSRHWEIVCGLQGEAVRLLASGRGENLIPPTARAAQHRYFLSTLARWGNACFHSLSLAHFSTFLSCTRHGRLSALRSQDSHTPLAQPAPLAASCAPSSSNSNAPIYPTRLLANAIHDPNALPRLRT